MSLFVWILSKIATVSVQENCTRSTVYEYPKFLLDAPFTSLAISLYTFLAITVLCDDYFIPAIEKLIFNQQMPPELMYATFIALIIASPKFFIHLVGTVMVNSDIGTGTIIGSTMFNIFALIGICALLPHVKVSLEWWDMTREMIYFSMATITLILILLDGKVYWYESLALCLLFLFTTITLAFDTRTQKHIHTADYEDDDDERTWCRCFAPIVIVPNFHNRFSVDPNQCLGKPFSLTHWPKAGCWHRIFWLISWPCHLIFILTIPDCKRKYAHSRPIYLLAIMMCTLWSALLSYLMTWTTIIVGDTLFIPDSILGITYLAIGTSMPEAVGFIMAAHKGYASRAVCNSLTSSTVNIVLALSIPWLLKAAFWPSNPGEHYIDIKSNGLLLIAIALLLGIILIYVFIVLLHFIFDYKIALISLCTYFACMVFACLLELNLIYKINAPVCRYIIRPPQIKNKNI